GSNWVLTGRYDDNMKTGDSRFPGHLNGSYANNGGTYGIEVNHTNNSAVMIGGGATNFELDSFEVANAGFAGLLIKTDNVPTATMDGLKIHDLYIHDTDSEGVYIGNTSTDANAQHPFTNLEFYNNRIVRTGTEALQVAHMGDNVRIHNNVFYLAALDWKNPFQVYQDGNFQIITRGGKTEIDHNIFIGAAGNLFTINFLAASGENVSDSEVYMHHNYFSSGRNYLGYILKNDSNKTSGLRFEDNWISQMTFQYDEINPANRNSNAMLMAFNNVNNPLILNNNHVSGSQAFIDTIKGLNGTLKNVSASGNVKEDSIAPVRFMDATFPADFDYTKIERWDDYSDTYKQTIYFEKGDYVLHNGRMYVNIKEGKSTGNEPGQSPDTWQEVAPMTDDLRLTADSPFQGFGLLDQTPAPGPE
ncbi:MAG: hypothetical protein J7559_00035, partial [Cohnella sp.]|nr:hypothetical protein [Cohnella sp.]